MPLSMIVWFLVGFLTWMVIAVYFGEIKIADLMIASMLTVTGPLLPLLIGAWYFGIWLESIAKIVLWKRKRLKPSEVIQV